MRVSILTIHFGVNYGSVLQTYAMYNMLEKYGCEAEVVDYVPAKYGMWRSFYKGKEHRYPLLLAVLAFIYKFPIRYYQRRVFRKFVKTNLKLSKRYQSTLQLKQSPPNADLYIVGSDQVWNYDYNDQNDFTYLFDFLPSAAKKISYAASIGKDQLSCDEKKGFQKYLASFSGVSVREDKACDLLRNLSIHSEHVLDPTLLLSFDEWLKLFKNIDISLEKYVLIYVMDFQYSSLINVAEKIAKNLNAKIYLIAFRKISDDRVSKQFICTSPQQFLRLFADAAYIVTNSFHGVAFSINFNKQFTAVGKGQYDERILSLLRVCELTSRFVEANTQTQNFNFAQINYDEVNQKLFDARKKSLKYLRQFIKTISLDCTGCGACVALCKHNAIELKPNGLDELIAVINKDKCVHCGICISECPQLNVPELRKATACYAAWVKNTDDYRTTSSGGVATALSRSIIKNNGIVYGAAFLPAKGVRHIRITEEYQLDTIKGSKYVQSYIDKDCYENITIDLNCGRKVLFIGTPCQIAGVKAFCGSNDNLLTIDLICHGTPAQKYFMDYLNSIILREHHEKISISFRCKSCRLKISVNGEVYYMKKYTHDLYYTAFMNNVIFRENCYSCKYAKEERCSDITIGDFWGIDRNSSALKIPAYPSCVLINTQKGELLFDQTKNLLFHETRLQAEATAGNYNLRNPSQYTSERTKFCAAYKKTKNFYDGLKATNVPRKILQSKFMDLLLAPYRIIRYGWDYEKNF